jgi:hypothetical protein
MKRFNQEMQSVALETPLHITLENIAPPRMFFGDIGWAECRAVAWLSNGPANGSKQYFPLRS